MKYKTIIFDFDNTITPTIPIHDKVYLEIFDVYGLKLDINYLHAMVGLLPRQVIAKIISDYQIKAPQDKLEEAFYDKLNNYIKQVTNIAPNFSDFVKKTHRLGYKLGIASSTQSHIIADLLKRFGLSEYFKVIVGGEDLKYGKPAPEMLLICLNKLGGKPAESISIDDALTGIMAAKSVGMYTIAYTYYNKNMIPEADLNVNNFNKIDLSIL